MLAIIKTGGKQYVAKVGQKIKVEKLEGRDGGKIVFPEVLLLADDKEKVTIGTPLIKGAKVEARIIKTEKGKKVVGIKFKAKKRYKVKFGHRQWRTEVEITKIVA